MASRWSWSWDRKKQGAQHAHLWSQNRVGVLVHGSTQHRPQNRGARPPCTPSPPSPLSHSSAAPRPVPSRVGGERGMVCEPRDRTAKKNRVTQATELSDYFYGSMGHPSLRVKGGRAKIGGATDPATSPVSSPSRRHVNLPLRHHAWRGTGVSPRHDNRHAQKC